MTRRLAHTGATLANAGGETSFTQQGNSFHPIAAVMQAMHGTKNSVIATLTGRDPRTVKYWKTKLKGMKAEQLIALLRDRHLGPAVRDALLAGVDWHETERAMLRVIQAELQARQQRADLRRHQQDQRRKLNAPR